MKEWIRKPEYEIELAKKELEARKIEDEDKDKARKEEEEEKQMEQGGKTVKRQVPIEEARRWIEIDKETSGLAHLRRQQPSEASPLW